MTRRALLETEEAQQAVRSRARRRCPSRNAGPIEMAYFDGLSYREVARELERGRKAP